ncbi:polysaccharide deacetylase family protein [Vibrio albus]|nr:polysaccharide deacetylase family protein [Vibrio albus]
MMLTKPRFSKKMNKVLAPATLAVLLTACASGPVSVGTQLQEDQDYIFFRAGAGDSYETIAQRYYGSAALSGKIREVNKDNAPVAGEVVAIPKRVLNPSGVYPDGYRTIPILCYHRFTSNTTSTDRLDLPAEQFRRQLQYLADNGYYVISLNELDQYMLGNREIPEKSVVLTIDDGYKSVYTTAYPLFKAFNVPATLFVYTDFIGATLGLRWDELKEMQQSGFVDIQSHSKSHTSLAVPPEQDINFAEEIRHQIRYPRALINQKLHKDSVIFSYPYGDSSDHAIEELVEQGIKMSVTVQQGGNPAFANPYLLKRTMIYADDTIDTFAEKLDVFHQEDLK